MRQMLRFLLPIVLLASVHGRAAAQLWVNYTNTGTTWNTAGNWSPAVVPIASIGTTLTFSSVPFTLPPTTGTFQTVGSYTTTNDFASPFVLNAMNFDGGGAPDFGTGGIIVSSSAAGGGLDFQGTSPFIQQNGSGSVIFADGAATNDLTTNSGHINIGGAGQGHVILNGRIAGSGGLVINHTGGSVGFTGGQVVLAPGAQSIFTGGVTLMNGNLALGGANNPLGDPTGSLAIFGGSLRGSGGAVTVPNPVTLNNIGGDLNVTGTQSIIFNGPVSTAVTNNIFVSGGSAVFHNNVTLGGGNVTVQGRGTDFPNLTVNNTGMMPDVNAVSLKAATLTLGNLGLVPPQSNLNNAVALSLSSATLTVTGNDPVIPYQQSLATTTLEGGVLFALNSAASPASLQLNGGLLNRDPLATFAITPIAGVGTSPPGTPGSTNLRFNNITAANNLNGVLPFGVSFGGNQATFVRYDNSNGVRPLNLSTDYTLSTNASLANQQSAATNFRVVSTVNHIESFQTIVVNALLIETASGAGTIGAYVQGSGLLVLNSGALATTLVGGTTAPTFIGTSITKDIQTPGAAYFHTLTDTVITGRVFSNAGLAKTGDGTLALLGDNSNLFGGLAVNGGTLAFTRDVNLGAPGTPVLLAVGASGTGVLSFAPDNRFESSQANSLSVSRSAFVTSGMGAIGVAMPGATLTWDGPISGAGRLQKTGPGTLLLTNDGNSYSSGTVIAQGTLGVSSNEQLGSGDIVFAGTSTATPAILQFNASFTTSKSVLLTRFFLNANMAFVNGATTTTTFDGPIVGSDTGTPFQKIGDGTLIATAASTFNGTFTQGEPTPTRHPGAPFPQAGGTVVLTGLDGAMAAATGYTLNPGATLILDNGPAIHQNRLSSSGVTLNGAELKVIGNVTGAVFEHVGRSDTVGLGFQNGGTITLEQPVTGVGLSTNLVATSYNPSFTVTGIAFFRGTNLGIPSPSVDYTRVIFATAPTAGNGLTNGLMTNAFYAPTATGAPTDFAQYLGSTNGVEAFTAYSPLPTAGGAITTTYALAGGTVNLTGAITNSNAFKMTNATVNVSSTTFNITGASMLLSTGNDAFTGTTGGTLAFGSRARISVSNSLTLGTAANPVILTGIGMNKFGPGTLSLSAVSNFSAGFTIIQGTVQLLTTAAFTSNALVTLYPGATLDTNNLGTSAAPFGIFNFLGFGTVNLGSGAISMGSTTVAGAYGGAFAGSGSVILNGGSAVTLNGNSPAFSGNVEIPNGNLIVDANVVPGSVASPGPLGSGTSSVLIGSFGGSTNATLTIGPNVTRFERNIYAPLGDSTAVVTLAAASTNQLTTVTGNIILERSMRLDGPFATTSYSPGATTLSGNITNGIATGSLVWFGGNYNLNGNNSYSGGTTVFAGNKNVLGLGSDSALGSGPITIANTSTFAGSFRADNGPRIIANVFQFAAGTTPSSVGFVGTNNLTFTSNSINLTGATRTFEVTGTGVTHFTGSFFNGSSDSAIIKTGGGILKLSGQSTFTGAFELRGGTLAIASSSTANSGPIGRGIFVVNGCTFRAEDGPQTFDNDILISSDVTINGANDIIMTGVTNIGSSIRRITVTNTGSSTFSSTIGPGGETGGLIKDGPSLLILSGSNEYTGDTMIDDGKLRINNTSGSGTGTGTATVMTGGKLDGTGIITGNVAVDSGGELTGGVANSPAVGVLTLNHTVSGATLTVAAGGRLNVGIHTATGSPAAANTGGSTNFLLGVPTNNNYIRKTGGTTSISTAAIIDIDVTGLVFANPGEGYSYKIAELDGLTPFSITASGQFNFTGVNVQTGASSLTGDAFGNVYLNFVPLPEPAWLAVLLGFVALWKRK